jgi:drug/metabolite transporter (DMT)-like permease
MSPLLALGASLFFGLSDFTGALAARRASALTVTLGMQLLGLVLLLPLLPFVPGVASAAALWIGALSGGVGTLGLVIYLRAMATGPIGIVSPLAAVSGAVVPVAWGAVLSGDRFSPGQSFGVVLALMSVALVAYVPGTDLRAANMRAVGSGLTAGLLFGLFFVALDATPTDSGLWPLVGAKIASVLGVVIIMRSMSRPTHPGSALRLILYAGTLDVAANILFLLATRGGQLSLSALLSSLYPVITLLLARRFLLERLARLQAAGVIGALVATGLLIAG